jgi:hypothetical protein
MKCSNSSYHPSIDHRPVEKNFVPSPSVSVLIEEVGSCSTLIAEKVFEEDPGFNVNIACGVVSH